MNNTFNSSSSNNSQVEHIISSLSTEKESLVDLEPQHIVDFIEQYKINRAKRTSLGLDVIEMSSYLPPTIKESLKDVEGKNIEAKLLRIIRLEPTNPELFSKVTFPQGTTNSLYSSAITFNAAIRKQLKYRVDQQKTTTKPVIKHFTRILVAKLPPQLKTQTEAEIINEGVDNMDELYGRITSAASKLTAIARMPIETPSLFTATSATSNTSHHNNSKYCQICSQRNRSYNAVHSHDTKDHKDQRPKREREREDNHGSGSHLKQKTI
jgi:hypothetical protein